jgi:hypothetical protein
MQYTNARENITSARERISQVPEREYHKDTCKREVGYFFVAHPVYICFQPRKVQIYYAKGKIYERIVSELVTPNWRVIHSACSGILPRRSQLPSGGRSCMLTVKRYQQQPLKLFIPQYTCQCTAHQHGFLYKLYVKCGSARKCQI